MSHVVVRSCSVHPRATSSQFTQLRGWLRQSFLGIITACLATSFVRGDPAQRDVPPAFGPHAHPPASDFQESRSFAANEPVVGVYYFYWYDDETNLHLVDHDGTDALTTHPPTLKGFSYKSSAWHERQLRDMMAAGIDFVLPVFWGAPSEQDPDANLHWSYAGIETLVEAREKLLRQGLQPPTIGLFYDTSTLQYNQWAYHADLTTDYGREWFYATIRDFFSMVPPRHWAMIEGRPLTLLYSAAFAAKYDQTVIDYAKQRFTREFSGRDLYLAPEVSWNVDADNRVAWGGALGLKQPGISSLGPGYDHSAVPGRKPLVVDRGDGKFYEEQWQAFLQRPSSVVVIETWNEFHEGTDVAESQEYGRQYIQLTRKYVDQFKRQWRSTTGLAPQHRNEDADESPKRAQAQPEGNNDSSPL